MHPATMNRLERLRIAYAAPLKVSSAYRCVNHPVEAKKAVSGVHTHGRAIDLLLSGANAHSLTFLAINAGFTGIGVNQKGEGRFIHIDDTTDFPRPTIWSY
jgi:zinc D-Ala-D-Ala carboxypeptidase